MATILLIEDDPAVAATLAAMLEEADFSVDGPYATMADGVAAVARDMPAGAVLDIGLRGGDVGLLADDLDCYGIPYVFCSGSDHHPTARAHPAVPLVAKPAKAQDLMTALEKVLH